MIITDLAEIRQVLPDVRGAADVEELIRLQIARLHAIAQPLFVDLPLAALSAAAEQTADERAGIDRAYAHYITVERLLTESLNVYTRFHAAHLAPPVATEG